MPAIVSISLSTVGVRVDVVTDMSLSGNIDSSAGSS